MPDINEFGDVAEVAKQDTESPRNEFGDIAIDRHHTPLEEAYTRIAGGSVEGIGSLVSGLPTAGRLAAQLLTEPGSLSEDARAPGALPDELPPGPTAQENLQALKESPLYKFGEEVRRGGREHYQTDPAYDKSFWFGKVPSAIGSTLSSAAAFAIPIIGPALGASVYGISQGEQERRASVEAGDIEDADKVFAANAVVGGVSELAIGAVPMFWKAIRRLRKSGVTPEEAGGSIRKFMEDHPVLTKTVEGGVREPSQEGLEQWGNNLIAKATYDPKREQTAGVGEAMLVSLPIGGGLGFVAGTAEAVSRPPSAGDTSKQRTDNTVNQHKEQMPRTAETVAAMQKHAETVPVLTEEDVDQILGSETTKTATTASTA